MDRDVMNGEKVTRHGLEAALRAAGCTSPTEVRFAILENNGQISVHPTSHRPEPAVGAGQ